MVTKEMGITEVVTKYPNSAKIFMEYGMGCLGCAAAQFENIEQGAKAHGVDAEALVKAINESIKQ